jgi:XTP/dITP diphosphohydrolase
MREILSGPDVSLSDLVRWGDLSEFPDWPEPVEDGPTFRANAEIKARHYARQSGLWTIADDSGLEVDALDGEPGVHSARYAGLPRSDRANNALLIERLRDVPADRRAARFRCVVVLSDPERILAWAEGHVDGRIIDEPRGDSGFGYDPHFRVASAGMTAAELAPEQKNAVSHRGQALRGLRDQMLDLLSAR